jgi:hypothetical protein
MTPSVIPLFASLCTSASPGPILHFFEPKIHGHSPISFSSQFQVYLVSCVGLVHVHNGYTLSLFRVLEWPTPGLYTTILFMVETKQCLIVQ